MTQKSIMQILDEMHYETLHIHPQTRAVAFFGKRWLVHKGTDCVVGQFNPSEIREWLKRQGVSAWQVTR